MNDLIISLTTYPKRYDYLLKCLDSIFSQSFFDKVSKFYINIDDNLTEEDYQRYNELKKLNDKIEIQICPAKWKSANKLVWTYKKHHDDVIVCFDDDKNYHFNILENLYNEWLKHKDCIIAYEINPAVYINDKLIYLNTVDLKLHQKEYGKYLSNACLFCPNCFSDLLFDYDIFYEISKAQHDELWFWLVSTLNGTKTVGLDWTYSFCLDDHVCFEESENDLTNINCKKSEIDGYNSRIDARFHSELKKIMDENPVEFFVDHSNVVAFLGNMQWLNSLYSGFRLVFHFDKYLEKSWAVSVISALKKYKWREVGLEWKSGY